MSHDFARSQRLKKESARKPARKKKGGVPSWLWLLVGTLVGCLIMFLVYLSGAAPQLPNLKSSQQPVVQPEQKTSEPAAPPKRVSPVFEFYTKLPEGGQPVTDIAPETPAPTTPITPPVPAETGAPDPIQQLLAEKAAAKPELVKPEPVKPEAAKSETAKPEATKPEPAKSLAAKSLSSGRYLQAGVFRNNAEVDKLKARLVLLGMKSTIQPVTNAKGETLQKVLVGPFSSTESMDDAKIILTGNGVNTIPVK
ncbi:MAG TPA: SPOR domain-containing protein [Pseudomonadales bacterium]|nr:SPOR domain-containing protein [Pseudomonadales bacterium]